MDYPFSQQTNSSVVTHIETTKDKLIAGLNKAADIITSTMGGAGSTVIITQNGKLQITKDGVSVARAITLPDPHENIGAQLLISACNQTVKETGDGTSLTALLLKEMVNAVSTMEEFRKLEKEVKSLHEHIKKNTKKITTLEQIKQIAFTATNDVYVSELFNEIYDKTSFETHIELERTEETETTISIDKGYRFDEGFSHNYQMTDTHKQCVKYDNPNFYVSNKPMHTVTRNIERAVELAIEHDIPLVFIAEKYSREFMRFIQLQMMHKKAKLLTLKIPGFGEQKYHELENIKAYLNNDTANSIYCTPYYTLLQTDESEKCTERITQLKNLSESVEDPNEARSYKSMYHRLSGNIATIWVGGRTKESRDEIYDRIEDAVGATKTAIKYGYVIGMGKCFMDFTLAKEDSSYALFTDIWSSAFNKIINNSGLSPVTNINKPGEGMDLTTGNKINLLEKGIIDPAHSLHTSLDNALTNTKLVLNTKYTLYNEL
jgi:chaperonin GroEL